MRTLSQQLSEMSPAKLALAAQQLGPQLALLKAEPIAIVGLSCRFPGGARSPEGFWHVLRDGVDAVTEVPQSRWDIDAYYDPDPETPGGMYTRYASFLEQVDQFDAAFFGIAPREAMMMDPQQRLLLEVSWESLEHAGLLPETLRGSRTGVFVGMMGQDYAHVSTHCLTTIDMHTGTGNLMSVAAGRLAYVFGWHGPTLTVDTACSSSLVSVHLACQSLRLAECDLALAGGVNVLLTPHLSVIASRAHMLAADGRCKTFDAAADGMGRGEGCGMLVLKRLSDAVADGDSILALIRGSAVNHDGRSSGLTVPNGPAQEQVIRQALDSGGVDPAQVSYVEAHGTGTALGDPIEVSALGAVFGRNRQEALTIGSVKTNIGHLEGAAGIAGLIKVVLALQHEEIPPHLHLRQPNPHIPWHQLPLVVATDRTAWPAGRRRLAGVSAFGMSGTNAHMVLEEAPQVSACESEGAVAARPSHLLTLSAKTAEALTALSTSYAHYLAAHPATPLEDICYTSHVGRTHFAHRRSVVAASHAAMQEKLQAFATGDAAAGLAVEHPTVSRPQIAFLCTGQGAQYAGMGRQLYATQSTFRHALDRCDAILRPYFGHSLLEVLYAETADDRLHQTAYTQPALFAVEYALAALWQSWGITPRVVLGHSVGEYVAACVAGVFSLEDGLKLVVERGRLMQALPQDGAMVAVMAAEEQVATAIAPYTPAVDIAAVNGPQSVVLSGRRESIEAVVQKLQTDGVPTRLLTVSHAFHSVLMEPMLAAFGVAAQGVTYAAPHHTLVSNVTGRQAAAELATPEYWGRHIRQTVRFADSIRTAHTLGCNLFVEIGPQPTLLGLGRQCLPDAAVAWLPSLRQGGADWEQLLTSLGALYERGVTVDWEGFRRDEACQMVRLPTYPFQRQRYWVPETPQRQQRTGASRTPVIDTLVQSPLLKETLCESQCSIETVPLLADHRVYGEVVAPAAYHLSLVLSAAELAFGAQPYEAYDIVFPTALVLPEGAECTVQVVFTPIEPGSRAVSFDTTSFKEIHASRGQPDIHATGRIVPTAPASSSPVSLHALQARCQEGLACTALYEAAHTRQLTLGPSLQWHAALWRGEREALGRLRQPQEVRSVAGYVLHPGLIDACFQLANLTASPTDPAQPCLPFSIDALRVYRSAPTQDMWGYAKQVEAQRWDIQLLDDAGHMVADIVGFETRPASREALRAPALWREWLYQVVWQPQPRATASQSSLLQAGAWLICADAAGLGAQVAARLRAHGAETVLVWPGDAYVQVDEQGYRINPEAAADYRRLLEAVPRVQGVVYLWSLDAPQVQTAAALEQAVQQVCAPTLYLLQALVQVCMSPPVLWLVTRAAQGVTPGEGVEGVAQSPLWGLGKVLALEHPELSCVRLDLDAAPSQYEAEALCAELMAATWSAEGREDQVALRADTRHVARLLPFESRPRRDLQVQADASYLISGGLGGLGLQVARWLLHQGARHLILMGRSTPSAAAQREVAALEAAGAQVVVARADVAVRQQVAQVLAGIVPQYPLKGIIHAAGVLDDGALLQQSWERFAHVLRPKVWGAWNLHTLTTQLPLDFFVLFASAAGLLGNSGQANYAAANTFLDSLAHYRRTRGLPALSIDWGVWSEVGMAAAQVAGGHFAALGVDAIPPQQGLQVLAHVLGQDAAQVGVVPVHWAQFRQQFASGHTPAFLAACLQQSPRSPARPKPSALRAQLQKVPLQERQRRLTAYLQAEVAKVLAMPEGPMPQQSFRDLGMNSLMAIELRNHLQATLDLPLPATLLFKYPNIQDLAVYMASQCGAGEAADPGAVPVLPALPDETEPRRTGAETEQLSQEQLAASLAEEVQKLSTLLDN